MINYYEVNFFKNGKRDKTLLKAVSRRDAITLAKAKLSGATVLKIKEVAPPLEEQLKDLKEKYFGKVSQKRANVEYLVSAIRQLAVMTNAGISIHDSIKEVTKSTVNPQLKEIFSQIDEDLKLVIVGTGPQENNIKKLIKEKNLKNKVIMRGHREDVAEILSDFDIFVLPSKEEALGTSILEASSCGVAVVGSRVGGIPECVREDKNGLLFESLNVEDLKNKLKRRVIISFSISTIDENLAKIFEPGAPRPEERLNTMKKCKEQGFFVGVNFIPVLPYLSDTEEKLDEMIKTAKLYGADFVLAGALTLFGKNPTDCKQLYYKTLEKYFPHLLPKYKSLFRVFPMPPKQYQKNLEEKVKKICKKYGVNYKILP